MFFIKFEYPINEKVDDVLNWLEKELQQPIERSEEDKNRVAFHSKRNGDSIEVFRTVYVKGETPAPGSLSFSFEVEKVTDSKSVITGKYQDENIHIEKLYYLYLARLGVVFSANFKESATKRLEEIKAQIIKESGIHRVEKTEWKNIEGTNFRQRGGGALVPNDPDLDAPRPVEAAKGEGKAAKPRKGKKKIVLQTKPAGRKVDEWNPRAFDILNDGKEDSELRAFTAWCEAQGITNSDKHERDAFKKAMDRERKRRNR